MEENDVKTNWEDKYLLPSQFDLGMLDETISAIGLDFEGSCWFIKDDLFKEER